MLNCTLSFPLSLKPKIQLSLKSIVFLCSSGISTFSSGEPRGVPIFFFFWKQLCNISVKMLITSSLILKCIFREIHTIYTEHVTKEDDMGIKIEERKITNSYLLMTLLVNDLTNLKRILCRFDTAWRNAGLNLNTKISSTCSPVDRSTKIKVNNTELEYVPTIKYLGRVS